METSNEEIILNLRAIIISNKGGVDLSDVNGDYKDTFGVDIPLKTMGYESLQEFFEKNPDNFILKGGKVHAVTKEASHHIVSLINKQANKNKKKKRGGAKMKSPEKGFLGRRNSSKSQNNIKPLKFIENIDSKAQGNSAAASGSINYKNTHKNRSWNKNSNYYANCSFKNILPLLNVNSYSGNVGNTFEGYLKQFCLAKKLVMPSYSVVITEELYKTRTYDCKLTMGDNFWVSTYPSVAHSEYEAKELASKKALYRLCSCNDFGGLLSEGDYTVKLKEVCWMKTLPEPVFRSYECCPSDRRNFYICEIRIGDNTFYSSYPIEALDWYSAREIAAMKAFDHLNFGQSPTQGLNGNYYTHDPKTSHTSYYVNLR